MVWSHYLPKKSLLVGGGGGWQTKFNVSPGPGLWSLVLGPLGPDLGPYLDLTWDLTWDLDLDLSLTILILSTNLWMEILTRTSQICKPPFWALESQGRWGFQTVQCSTGTNSS